MQGTRPAFRTDSENMVGRCPVPPPRTRLDITVPTRHSRSCPLTARRPSCHARSRRTTFQLSITSASGCQTPGRKSGLETQPRSVIPEPPRAPRARLQAAIPDTNRYCDTEEDTAESGHASICQIRLFRVCRITSAGRGIWSAASVLLQGSLYTSAKIVTRLTDSWRSGAVSAVSRCGENSERRATRGRPRAALRR